MALSPLPHAGLCEHHMKEHFHATMVTAAPTCKVVTCVNVRHEDLFLYTHSTKMWLQTACSDMCKMLPDVGRHTYYKMWQKRLSYTGQHCLVALTVRPSWLAFSLHFLQTHVMSKGIKQAIAFQRQYTHMSVCEHTHTLRQEISLISFFPFSLSRLQNPSTYSQCCIQCPPVLKVLQVLLIWLQLLPPCVGHHHLILQRLAVPSTA